MKTLLHRVLPLLAFPLALLGACADSESSSGAGGSTTTTETGPIDVKTIAGCNPLSPTDACLLPFPSRWNETADPSSPTGVRWNLSPDALPKRDGLTPLTVKPFNTADGASPVVPILAHFGFDLDLSKAPSLDTLDSSMDGDTSIAIFNMDSGKRVRFFAEMDLNHKDGYEGRYAVILRPVEPMEMGSHTVVVMRDDLKKADGTDIDPTPAFKAIRDAVPTTNADVEALRPGYEEVFSFLEKNGYPRGRTVLAWDFHVASQDYLLGSVLSMREKTFGIIAEGNLQYTVESVQDSPSADVFRIVEGDFEVPTFIKDDDTIEYDADHHPILQPKNRMFPYTMVIPQKITEGPLPLVVIGHGIFGEGRAFLTSGGDGEALQKLAQQFGAVLVATDWIGLSGKDFDSIANGVATNLDNVSIITDKLQQSLMNNLTMTKLVRQVIAKDNMVAVNGQPLLDDRVFYWGASLGGIQGSAFISLSDEIPRAVFGVPGSAWGTMLSRSIVFSPIKLVIQPYYPDPLDVQILISLFQARFDHTDPANITKLMFKAPLPDAPKDRRVILQEAIGDSEVPNISTEILARQLGVKLMTPSFYPVSGLEEVTSPADASILSQYRLADYDNPEPPAGDIAPASDNGVHHAMNFLPNCHLQIAELFFNGDAQQYCSEACDPD
ncbi:MAG: hypothetical protein U0441_10245 [Polyangiaceae bacterium]